MPTAQTALLLLDHRGEHGADERGHSRGSRQDDGRRNGIALVRHGGRATATVRGRLKNFADFGLHMERDVAGDFAESSAAKPESRGDFRQAIAMAVPGKFWQRKLQFFGKIGGDVQTARAESRHGSDRAAKLKHDATLLRFRETRAMTVDRVEPTSYFQAESRGKRLLHPSAGHDDRCSMFVDQFAENDSKQIKFRGDQIERLAQLKYAAGVDGVLTGGAPMHIAGGFFLFFGDEWSELFHQGNGEISGGGC